MEPAGRVPLVRRPVAWALAAALVAGCTGVTPVDSSERPWTPGTVLGPGGLPPAPQPVEASSRAREPGHEIVVAGRPIPVGTRVVLWSEPGGYSAYASQAGEASFEPGRPDPAAAPGAPRSRESGAVLRAVDQLVLHYDACGLSRICFQALERRSLSVHFLLDIDGTLYQTLDLADTAWHARQANSRSIGVEIANIGAYPPGEPLLDEWYGRDAQGIRLTVPYASDRAGVLSPGFVGRPVRPTRIRGIVHDQVLEQYDFTREQYEALARLTAALIEAFPKLQLQVPVDRLGSLRQRVLGEQELGRFRGVLGHQHLTTDKTDPGPAFDWLRYVRRTRQLMDPAPARRD